MSNTEEQLEEVKAEAAKQKKGLDKSLLFSLLAIFISLVGTGISVFEASILREQQTTMQEQKAAAVWPYIQAFPWIDYKNNGVIVTYTLENKGIGPAIFGDVTYRFRDNDDLESYLFDEAISDLYEELKVTTYSNIQVDHIVLSAGETVDVVRLFFSNVKEDEGIDDILNKIAGDMACEFCYCSVYNDCWQLGQDRRSQPVADCEVAVSF